MGKWLRRKAGVVWLCLLMGACAAQESQPPVYSLGDSVSTYWFDFIVEKAERGDTYGSYQTQEGRELIICDLRLENTFDEAVPMGWADFILTWDGAEGEDSAYALPTITDGQLPEEYELAEDGRMSGQLVFEIPEGTEGLQIVFQELYVEGDSGTEYSEGASYQVALD